MQIQAPLGFRSRRLISRQQMWLHRQGSWSAEMCPCSSAIMCLFHQLQVNFMIQILVKYCWQVTTATILGPCLCTEFSSCSTQRSILHPWDPRTCRQSCGSACTSSSYSRFLPHRPPSLSAQSNNTMFRYVTFYALFFCFLAWSLVLTFSNLRLQLDCSTGRSNLQGQDTWCIAAAASILGSGPQD